MEGMKTDNSFYLRIDKEEEVLAKIKEFCKANNIRAGLISGLGNLSYAELGLFDVEKKEFIEKEFKGIYEIASMNGNISMSDGETYLHIHAVISNRECTAFGGHLAKGVVAATCEVVIIPSKGNPGRMFSDETGLNLLYFKD